MFFAGWFTVYHCFLFVRLMDRFDQWCAEPTLHPNDAYNVRALCSDVLDSLALFLAFGAINLQSGAFQAPGLSAMRTGLLYVAALAVPVSALVARHDQLKPLRVVLVTLAFMTSATGAVLNFGVYPDVDSWNWGLLIGLWALLLAYIVGLYWREA
jgi:hypothetical protein